LFVLSTRKQAIYDLIGWNLGAGTRVNWNENRGLAAIHPGRISWKCKQHPGIGRTSKKGKKAVSGSGGSSWSRKQQDASNRR
jgi:hypothetical protein